MSGFVMGKKKTGILLYIYRPDAKGLEKREI